MMKSSHSAFAKPPMSWLRKMSTITWNRMKIQTTKRKNINIHQKAARIGYWLEAASIGLLLLR